MSVIRKIMKSHMININENNDVQNDEEDTAKVKVTRTTKGSFTLYLNKKWA